ncbi:MAG: glycosyltransferase [Prevotella sp.]|nr:glycosyltransferase [Prevotella sp.]
MKLSVIIPVYLVEETLDRCIRSIVAQSFTDMEIILVDDGSTDNCPQMCDDWQQKDQRIRVIHKSNGGLSDARNAGISISTGEYVTFVDSDDYVDKDTYDSLMSTLAIHPDYDILEYPVYLYEGSAKEQLLTFEDKEYHNIRQYWYSTSAYLHTYACNKIYKRSIFHHITFPAGKVFEDIHTYPLLLSASQHIATTSKGLYHYCFNTQGITSTADGHSWRMLMDAHMKIISNPIFQPITEDYLAHLVNIQLYTNELTGDKPILPKTHFHHVVNGKTILYNLLGINTLCKLNRIFRKIVKRR